MHRYFVSRNEQLTASTLLLTLVKDQREPTPFSFQPGQYAAISFKRHGRPTAARCFSIVSSPTDQNLLQFSMRTNGRYTKALARLNVGDEIKVRGPFGGFVIGDAHNTDIILLAGGIGITPFISMIRYATATNFAKNITLLFSSKNQHDVPFVDELVELARNNPRFRPIFILGEGPTDKLKGQLVAKGRITSEIIDKATGNRYENTTFFICGPQAFMRGMSRTLREKGVPANKVLTEAFSQGPNQQTGKIRSWPFNVYVLSTIGLALSSFVVMISDLLKTLPPSSIQGTSTEIKIKSPTNSRQAELDSLVNSLPEVNSTAPPSAAVAKAYLEAGTPTPTSTTVTPTPTSTPSPTPKPKTCTTSSTGVVTCI